MLDTSRRQVVAGSGERMRPGTAFGGQRQTQTYTSPLAWETWPGPGKGGVLCGQQPWPCPTGSTWNP